MAQFALKLQDIDESGKDWSFQIDPAWLITALGDSNLYTNLESAPGSLQIHALLSGTEVLVQGRIQTRVFASCSRCLEDVALDLNLNITTLFAPAATRAAAGAEIDVDAAETDQEYYSGPEVELDSVVRELILLEDPMQPLCASDCRGIELPKEMKSSDSFDAKTEDGEPIDRRFAPLLKLKEKLANQIDTKEKSEE